MGDCSRCKKTINYDKGEKAGWVTQNGPGLPHTQQYVCESCRETIIDQHTTAWAKEIAGHFRLTTWHKPSIEETEMIRKKVIQLLREGSAYDESARK